MRISPIAAALATALASASSLAHAAGSVIVLQTPLAQATKVSQNGEYVSAFVNGGDGVRWTASTGNEDVLAGLQDVNGVNNLGWVAGIAPVNGGSQGSGSDIPAVSKPGDSAPTTLPLVPGLPNATVYDVSDNGIAVGLAYDNSFVDTAAYYYSPVDGIQELPTDNHTSATRANVISADGHVVGGWSDHPETGARRGVVWVDRVVTYVKDAEGNELGETDGVSGNGQWAVGGGWRMNVQTGQVDMIDMPFAFGVSDDGKTIVGASGFFDVPPRALLIWTEAGGTQQLTDYLAERAIELPAGLTPPLQGGLGGVSGDGATLAGWALGQTGPVSLVVIGANSPLDHLFADGFDPPPPPPVVTDGGFEETDGLTGANPNWAVADSSGGVLLYSGIPTHAGGYAAWFGGWGGDNAETETLAQTVTMPASGPQYLNYWRFAAELPDVPGTLTVSIDGTPVETTDLTTILPDEDYVQQSIDISSYADGAPHAIEFKYEYPGAGATDGNLLIDDVSIDATPTPNRQAFGRHLSRTDARTLRKHAKR